MSKLTRSKVCEVKPANLRDLSYIAAHMRASDRQEIECQLDEWSAAHVAAMSLRDYAFIVELNGNPEAAFGAGQVRKGYWLAWSWGTDRIMRCLPTMIHFITERLQPAVYEAGALRVEARALKSHTQACAFLKRIGGHHRCDLPAYGKGGEDFIMFDWTRDSYVPGTSTWLRLSESAGTDGDSSHAGA